MRRAPEGEELLINLRRPFFRLGPVSYIKYRLSRAVSLRNSIIIKQDVLEQANVNFGGDFERFSTLWSEGPKSRIATGRGKYVPSLRCVVLTKMHGQLNIRYLHLYWVMVDCVLCYQVIRLILVYLWPVYFGHVYCPKLEAILFVYY